MGSFGVQLDQVIETIVPRLHCRTYAFVSTTLECDVGPEEDILWFRKNLGSFSKKVFINSLTYFGKLYEVLSLYGVLPSGAQPDDANAIVIRQDDSLTNDSSSQLQSIDTTAHQWDGSLSIATIPQSTAVQQWCEPPFCIDAVTPLISMATLSPDEAVWLNMPSGEESRSAAHLLQRAATIQPLEPVNVLIDNQPNITRARGRPRKSQPNSDEMSVNIQPIITRARGRPRKSQQSSKENVDNHALTTWPRKTDRGKKRPSWLVDFEE
ncbi:hypothetical protein DAPPUDRAFT_320254 [Daphnia pulex]|uniref:Uncharacterized protein n=1 Tax=Daphnia pulex TaxID=6669 RepID=E9GPC1_DAPPU|nr:hypothetical protein DAPPUDRAFT_320254 [Daphnia pulex]|eukprot:EFX78706.1 hypothetical protein DAPPUDRAFT_320254 [Daphnia pulex]